MWCAGEIGHGPITTMGASGICEHMASRGYSLARLALTVRHRHARVQQRVTLASSGGFRDADSPLDARGEGEPRGRDDAHGCFSQAAFHLGRTWCATFPHNRPDEVTCITDTQLYQPIFLLCYLMPESFGCKGRGFGGCRRRRRTPDRTREDNRGWARRGRA